MLLPALLEGHVEKKTVAIFNDTRRYRPSGADLPERSRTMRILMVLYGHSCGGAQRHLVDLMEGLRGEGDHPVFAGPLDSWLGANLQERGFPVHHVALRGSALDLYSLWNLCRLIKKERIDLVHTHLGRAAYYGGLAGKFCKVPVVTTIHGADYYRHLRHGREGRIIAVSAAVKEFLINQGLPPAKITVVHNGIKPLGTDRRERLQQRQDLGLASDEYAFCTVARFHPVKRHELLIESFVAAQLPKAKLYLVGESSGACYAAVKAKVTALQLENKIIFLGHRDDVPQLLQAMDAVILSSRWEGLGLTLLEAMSAGVPVIAAAVGGIPEVVVHKRTGYLFTEASELTALLRLVASRQGDDTTLDAIRVVNEHFSQEGMITATRGVYSELLVKQLTQ